MKSRLRMVAGLAVVLSVGVAVWARGAQERQRGATLTIDGQPGGRVQITVDAPGKQHFKVDLTVEPDGKLTMRSKDGHNESRLSTRTFTLRLDAFLNQDGK